MKNHIRVLLLCVVLMSLNVSLSVSAAEITRSAFTTEIVNKEPLTELKEISVDVTRIYFFTEITGLNGHTVTHRWEYNGQVMAEVNFEINANRWRTWSSKNMLSSWVGKWQVSVLDEGGNLIEQSEFEYVVPALELQPEHETIKPEIIESETIKPEINKPEEIKPEEIKPEETTNVKTP